MTGVVARRVGVAGRACYSRRVARSCLLVAMALWVVWLPVETVPLSAVVGAVVVMVLLPRARARWAAGGMWPLAAAATLVIPLGGVEPHDGGREGGWTGRPRP